MIFPVLRPCLALDFESAMDLERFQRLLAMTSEEDERAAATTMTAATVESSSSLTQETADALLSQLAVRLGLGGASPGRDRAIMTSVGRY